MSTKVGKGHAKGRTTKPVTFVFKGSFTAPGTVAVRSGNAHARRGGFAGHAVTFDFSGAKVTVADSNGDGIRNLADVKDGDAVLIQARMARGTKYAEPTDEDPAEPVVARKLVDKTHAPIESDDSAGTDPR